MLAVDLVKYRLEQRTQKRSDAQSERFQRSQADIEATTSQIVLDSSSSSSAVEV